MIPFTVAEIAQVVDGKVHGDPNALITGPPFLILAKLLQEEFFSHLTESTSMVMTMLTVPSHRVPAPLSQIKLSVPTASS
jgi:hypothetical protein